MLASKLVFKNLSLNLILNDEDGNGNLIEDMIKSNSGTSTNANR